MWVLILLLVALGVVAAILQMKQCTTDGDIVANSASDKVRSQGSEACNTCAADGTGCYADRMLRHAVQNEPQYFEDEELDAYCGTPADAYTVTQEEQFAEVLHTLKQEEVADWLHALALRGIEFPAALRDEAVMLMKG